MNMENATLFLEIRNTISGTKWNNLCAFFLYACVWKKQKLYEIKQIKKLNVYDKFYWNGMTFTSEMKTDKSRSIVIDTHKS